MKRYSLLSSILLAAILFVAVNVVATLTLDRYRLDFTDDHRFTLSDGTKHVLDKLNQPITLRLFFSNQLANGIPYLKTYAARVKSFLQAYAAYGHGNITLEFVDPKPYSDAENLAISYGLKGVPINKEERKAYFGIVATNAVDEVRSIPVFTFDREKFTEYELTRMIYDLSTPSKPTLGIFSTLPMGEQGLFGLKTPGLMGSRAWVVVQQLQQIMTVKMIPKDAASIPGDIDILMVVQPDKDTKEELFKSIDQFMIAGKPTILFLDPHAESKGGGSTSDNGFDPRMEPLLKTLGITLPRDVVIADRLAARKVKDDTIKSQVDYIAWLAMKEDNISHDDMVTAGLKTLHLGTTGFLQWNPQARTSFSPLITSNIRAMRMDVAQVRGKPDPNRTLEQFVSEDRPFVLAARIAGLASSAYDATQEGKVNVVVIADTDLLRDETWSSIEVFDGYQIVRPVADNAAFVANMADYLSGNSDLIGLRGRGSGVRPFTRVEALKRQSEERYLTERKALQERLQHTERRLASLQKQAQQEQGNASLYRMQQQGEIKQFTDDMTKVRERLRYVQQALYQQVEALERVIKCVNILLIPVLVAIWGVIAYFRKSR